MGAMCKGMPNPDYEQPTLPAARCKQTLIQSLKQMRKFKLKNKQRELQEFKPNLELSKHKKRFQINLYSIQQAQLQKEELEKCKPNESYAKVYQEKPQLTHKNLQIIQELGEYKYDKQIDSFYPQSRTLEPYILQDGNIYHGQWLDGDRHGRGKQYFKDGSYYEGYWTKNLPDKHGLLIHATGEWYRGQWVNGIAQGQGEYEYLNGENRVRYKGEMVNNQPDGKGEEVWSDKSVFVGDFKYGKKEGKGEFRWSDGSYYKGDFHEDFMEGFGEFMWADGRKYTGYWKASKMNGQGEYKHVDGGVYVGNFENDFREGEGTYTGANGQVLSGVWSKGKLNARV